MTTAADLDTRTAITDLRIRLATTEARLAARESCITRLNQLLAARDAEIGALNAALDAALVSAFRGEVSDAK